MAEICHIILDLLIHAVQNSSATTSPSTPTSPSPHTHASPHNANLSSQQAPPPLPVPFKHDTLMRLKIHLREIEHPGLPRDVEDQEDKAMNDIEKSGDTSGLGKNEGTMRFLFAPERLIGAAV